MGKHYSTTFLPVTLSPTPVYKISTPAFDPDVSPNPSWKTYVNPTHKISFKYPPTWQIDNTADKALENAQIILTKEKATITMYFNLYGIGGQGQNYQGRPFELSGYHLYRFTKTNSYNNTQQVGISTSLIDTLGVFEIKGKTYSITLTYPISDAQTEIGNSSENEFDQILSTFKFIKPSVSPTPTCRPRPECLDQVPVICTIVETSDMCPPSPRN